MNKRNSVKIDKNVKKSPITAGDGNNLINGNKIDGNNNKIIIIVKQLIKSRYMILALILIAGLYLIHLIQKPPVTNVNITNVPAAQTKEDAKSALNPFKTDMYGIIVAQFNGNTEDQKNKGKEIQSTIQNTLNARFKELGINDADARKTPDLFESHDQARDFGKKYQAQLVIWGDVTLQGIIPNITVVNQKDTTSDIFKPETTILKDSLCHAAMAQIKDIRFSTLTDEPTKLVSFVTAMKYFDKENYEKAIEYFTYSLPEQSDKYIDSSAVLFYRGNSNYFMKQYDKAVDDWTQAISLNPKKYEVYTNRGGVYYSKGKYDKAIADYTQAISLNPKNYEVYTNRGVVYYSKGEYDKAIPDYTQAISLNPKKYEAYTNRGVVYYSKGKYDKAIADYTQAISLNPKNYEAYTNRGAAYYNKGEYDKAIADYTQAISLNPKDYKAYTNRGGVYYSKGEYDKAIPDYTQAISLNPKDDQAYYNRGFSYGIKGEYDKAIADFNQAISLNPKRDEAYYNRGSAYGKKGEYDKAISDYTQAISLNPKDYQAYYNRGSAYGIKGEYDKTIADFNQAISLNPKDDQAYYNRGSAYGNKGEYDKAIADFNQAIKNTPQFSSEVAIPYNSMSWLLATCPDDKYRDGNKAVEFAKKATEFEPKKVAYWSTLAVAYAEAGKFEDAVKTQEKAIKMLNEKDKDAITRYTERLNFYKARKPWREMPPQKSNLN